jgi:hypothetical protein
MIDYPMDLIEFEKEFETEDRCREYIIKLRYKNGIFACPLCGSEKSYPVKNNFLNARIAGIRNQYYPERYFRIPISR